MSDAGGVQGVNFKRVIHYFQFILISRDVQGDIKKRAKEEGSSVYRCISKLRGFKEVNEAKAREGEKS